MIVFLIGYMGCGKTSIGRSVSKRLGLEFVDMDKAIEQECGKTVNEIFACEGEARFRELERELIERLAQREDDVLVATGGGAPCFGDNMERLNRAGGTVYLRMSPEKLMGRLSTGKWRRPLIKDLDDAELVEFIRRSLAVREPCYLRAGMVVECDGASDYYIGCRVAEYIECSRINREKNR